MSNTELEGCRRRKLAASAGVGVEEGQERSVQHQARGGGRTAVERIAEDWTRQPAAATGPVGKRSWSSARGAEVGGVGGVDAELVGAAGDGVELDAGAGVFSREDSVASDGRAAVREIDDLVG